MRFACIHDKLVSLIARIPPPAELSPGCPLHATH